MIFVNASKNLKVETAIQLFLNRAPKIINALASLPAGSKDFTYTSHENREVAQFLSDAFYSSVVIKIVIQKTKNPFSSCIGWTNGTGIHYINGWKINKLSVEDIAGNVAHEFCHHPCGFGHGTDKIDSVKKLSVPYAFGYLISQESNFPIAKYRPQILD